jgi:hypothetical protein
MEEEIHGQSQKNLPESQNAWWFEKLFAGQ